MTDTAATVRDFLHGFSSVAGNADQALETRVQQLCAAGAAFAPADFLALVEECYRSGDNAEKVAVLRALSSLPGAARFLPLAIEACRTNVLPVFEAITCENPFIAQHFPEPNFNQAVLKALFLGVDVQRLQGLAARQNLELERMLRDFAAERRAAGRPVPPGVAWLLALEPPSSLDPTR